MTTDEPKKPRGFAAMSPEKRREISKVGGKKSAAVSPYSFKNNEKLASEAGRKGGTISRHPGRKAHDA